MNRAARIRRALKPYLEQRPDLAFAGCWIFIKPLHHIYRGVAFEKVYASGEFVATWSVSPMFDHAQTFHLIDGKVVYAGRSARFFLNDAASLDAFFAELDERIVPLLTPIRSIDDFIPFVDGLRVRAPVASFPRRYVKILAALGRFDEAREVAQEIAEGRNGSAPPDLEASWGPIVTELHPLLEANDREGVARLLRRWEGEVAAKYGLLDIWEPTPFPFEVATS